MNSIFSLQNLRKSHGERLLLNVEALEMLRGSTYLLLGENGVGKTTLLKIMAGLEAADNGNFQFDGQSVNNASERAALAPRLIYVHQHSYLFYTSVAENIGYGLKLRGIAKNERDQLVAAEMAWAGISHLRDVPPNQLSGGEKQRVAMARARVLKPELLLLDEPTANLDDAAREQVVELIAHMRDANNCVVIATHDKELSEMQDAVKLKLEDGRVQ
ncbi:MAG: ABC transporter ATP-binding protein [Methylophilales bacterium]|nr:ABC transporter ATP-binding protein [Methylophilales bacterium]